ncbi:MAG TPA: hypothetical protein VIV66_12350 [Pyrinomonadaceae bacterium]
MDLSTRNLTRALSIRREIDSLERRLERLIGSGTFGDRTTGASLRYAKRRM